jgi:bacteriorhodopsin
MMVCKELVILFQVFADKMLTLKNVRFMETLTDVAINPDPYLQKGDLVAAMLFFESLAMIAITAFLIFQVNQVPRRWRNNVVVGIVMMLVAALAAIYRRDFWIDTVTNPVEFKFFDWFLTVPLMGLQFFMLARPYGAKIGMLLRLQAAILFMLVCGYFGEAVFPEQAILNGSLATLGLVAMISLIMVEGYPKVASRTTDPVVRNGYLWLGLSLPVTWLAYPIGYLSVPGNLAEGFMSPESVLILYSVANILSKGGLVLAIYLIAVFSKEAKGEVEDRPLREQGEPVSNQGQYASNGQTALPLVRPGGQVPGATPWN